MLRFRQKGSERSPKITQRKALNYYRGGGSSSKSPFRKSPRSKRRGFLAKFLDWLVIFIILAGVVYSLILRPQPKIVLSSSVYHSTEAYRKATVAALKSLKNSNKLTFDEKALERGLKQQFPEINDVSANLPLFGQEPTIHINIAVPSLVLRGAEGTTSATNYLVVDSNGTVVGPQADFPSVKDLPLITDESGIDTRTGRLVLSQSDISFILSVIAQTKKANISIALLTLPRLAQELDLRTTDRAYFVKFYLDGDALIQGGQFLAARQHFDQTNKQPQQYLDVRVSGKIFYQ